MKKHRFKTLVQRLFITADYFTANSMANHAAACAYGFLLSIGPLLLIIFLFMFNAFPSSPHAAIALMRNIPFFETIFNREWLTSDLLHFSVPGIAGIIFLFSVFWAGRILAVSLQRGLKVIFTGEKKRNPVTDNLIIFSIEILALILSLMIIFFSQTAMRLYEMINFIPETSILYPLVSDLGSKVFTSVILGIVAYCAYRFIPVNHPRWLSALRGSIFCILSFECTTAILGVLLMQSRYNFLYGAMGNIIVLLINVYFFFIFFFFGSQYAFVIDSFDALHFIRMRKARMLYAQNLQREKQDPFSKMPDRLFYSIEGNLKKYLRYYRKGETILFREDKRKEIFYLLEGEADVLILSAQNSDISAGTLNAGSFFGEMSYLLSEKHSATIRAKTDVSVLALSYRIFDEILKYDTTLDRAIIEHMSRRIKDVNAQIAALTKENSDQIN